MYYQTTTIDRVFFGGGGRGGGDDNVKLTVNCVQPLMSWSHQKVSGSHIQSMDEMIFSTPYMGEI